MASPLSLSLTRAAVETPSKCPSSANEAEIDLDEDKEQFGSVRSNSRAISNGVVGAIVRTARNLPENVTLGDSLGDFDGRICEEIRIVSPVLARDPGQAQKNTTPSVFFRFIACFYQCSPIGISSINGIE
ncbi:hypothetical protein SDJN03_26984, partial [Cucurbita argyrosperma subsp. sororia]